MAKWIEGIGPERDVIISSRIRLARNLEEFPFPVALTKEKSKKMIESISDAIIQGNSVLRNEFDLIRLEDISPLERQVLIEKHLISVNLAESFEKSAALLNKDESVSIMVNEEDHIRIQCLLPGFQLKEAYHMADKIDDVLEEKIRYAFDERFGYLTSCPTNVGTGIRASVMAHLPALSMTGYIKKILEVAGQVGLAIRGLYGEGSEFSGNIFQISNQLTLGRSEEEILENLNDITKQIIQKERDTRNAILSNKGIVLEDKIYRSFGVLSNARILTSKECMKLLSDVKLGAHLGILKDVEIDTMNQIMVMIQPAYLQKIAKNKLNDEERDRMRAELVRERMKG